MTTKLDTTIISGPVPKESDVDAPVSLPPKETEVVRKADKVSREVLDRGRCAYPVLERRVDNIGLACVVGGVVLIIVGTATALPVGQVYGGITGLALGGSLPTVLGTGMGVRRLLLCVLRY
ncbi:MAG: hypothetical protein OXF02_06310 [Simkaniaceae bacterium]|nr:hypothetical protein [Simkaniaceae bacterium]